VIEGVAVSDIPDRHELVEKHDMPPKVAPGDQLPVEKHDTPPQVAPGD